MTHIDSKPLRWTVLLIALLPALACGGTPPATPLPPTSAPTSTSVPPTVAPTSTPEPTLAPTDEGPPVSVGIAMSLPTQPPEKVKLDFYARVCEAQWMNNGKSLPCPGDPANTTGSVVPMHEPSNGHIVIGNDVLQTIPAYDEFQLAIFGRYPPLVIEVGFYFRAALTIAHDTSGTCEVEYSLGYFDAQGVYTDYLAWVMEPNTPWMDAQADLSRLAGQAVELTLAVRNTNGQRCEAMWVAPVIVGG